VTSCESVSLILVSPPNPKVVAAVDGVVTSAFYDGAGARHLLNCRFQGNLPQFAAFLGNLPALLVELTNQDFPCPAWKIAIGSLATSALATPCISLVSNSLLLLLLLSLVFLYSSNLQASVQKHLYEPVTLLVAYCLTLLIP